MSSDVPYSFDADWPVVSLAEVTTKIGSGATPRGGAESYLPARTNFAFVRSQNVYDRHFDESGLAFISDAQADALKGVALAPGDVLLNITGDGVTFGRAAMVGAGALPACVNQHVAIIRADPRRADPGYLLAYLTHPDVKPYIASFNAGGSRRAVTKGHIQSFRLPLPPLDEQRAIAATLGALDDKIESNRRAIGLLRELAVAHLRAAASGRRVVADVAEIRKGLSYKGAHLVSEGEGMPMVNMGNAENFGWLKRSGFKFYNGETKSKHHVAGGSLLVTGVEQTWKHEIIGWPLLVPDDVDEALFTHHMLLVDFAPQNQWMRLPLWAFLYTPEARAILEGSVYGTTVATLPVATLGTLEFSIPNPDSLAIPAAESMLRRAWCLERESQTLASSRDTLLPALLSGKIRVMEAVV